MDYDGFLELAKKRRSVRRFKSDPIPDEYVDKIIEAARWAPSGYNSQPWDFVVVKDKKLKDSMVQILMANFERFPRMEATKEPWMRQTARPLLDAEMDYRNAPVFIILLGDTRAQIGLPMVVRFDPYRRQSVFTSSLASAFLYMHLAATALGLASQWVSAVAESSAHCLLADLLGIPRELEIYDMMAVGYPAYKPRAKLMRDVKKMVHYGYCGEEDFRTDEEVNDYARRASIWAAAILRRGAD